MLEIVYHGNISIEIRSGESIYIFDTGISQCIEIDNYSIFYVCDLIFEAPKKEFDAVFISVSLDIAIDDVIAYVAQFTSKYVIPMCRENSLAMTEYLQQLARRIMLDNYGVPKVLKSGQMLVI